MGERDSVRENVCLLEGHVSERERMCVLVRGEDCV